LKRIAALLLFLLLQGAPLLAQRKVDNQDRYDDVFRKYSKRFFGVGFDWHYFKAQGLAESGLDPKARSPVGARGVMQLMPGTYAMIKKARSEQFGNIEDPEWNIAAGILFSRDLWHVWADNPDDQERLRFMFGSYNAGQGTIKRATNVAKSKKLDTRTWKSIETVAPNVQRWRYKETIPYVRKIEENHRTLNGANRSKLLKKVTSP
jgi:membrane-bound lytic murein transglycosylase MltF